MATDLSLSSDQQVLALINADNVSSLNETHVVFGTPTVLTDDVDGKNTTIDVVSRPNGGYNGTVPIKYDRLNIADFSVYGDPILVIPDGGGLNEIVIAFNNLYGANLSIVDDIDDSVALPTVDYEFQNYTLTTKDTSYAYFGSIVISVRFETTELSSVIVTSTFEGLEYPPPFYGVVESISPSNTTYGGPPYLATAPIYEYENKLYYPFGNVDGSSSQYRQTFNIETQSWEAITSFTQNLFNIRVGKYGYLVSSATLQRIDLDLQNTNIESLAPPPSTLGGIVGCCTDGIYIYRVGGRGGSGSGLAVFNRYHIASNTWDSEEFNLNTGPNITSTGAPRPTIFENDIYFLVNQRDIWRLNLSTRMMSIITQPPKKTGGNQYGSLVTFNDRLFAFNFGIDGSEIYEYDLAQDEWTLVASYPWGTVAITPVVAGDGVYLFRQSSTEVYRLS